MTIEISIIGRPNVGKSTLFNRLIGRHLALVADKPGVTRDTRKSFGEFLGIEFTLADTAGIGGVDIENKHVAKQAAVMARQSAIHADLLLFVIDAVSGITSVDRELAKEIRRLNKDTILLLNKAEKKGSGYDSFSDALKLGFNEPIAISAQHGEGMAELYEALREYTEQKEKKDRQNEELKEESKEKSKDESGLDIKSDNQVDTDTESNIDYPIKIAVIGRPNVGKSTLLNDMIGEERFLAGDFAGLTRDSVSAEIKVTVSSRESPYIFELIDTSGLRRKSRIIGQVEKLAARDAIKSIKKSHIVIILLDISRAFDKQDNQLISLVEQEGKGLVLVLNKWDLVALEERRKLLRRVEAFTGNITFSSPKIITSSIHGNQNGDRNLEKIYHGCIETHRNLGNKLPTAELNDLIKRMLRNSPPPMVRGRRIKVKYATQISSYPPHFLLFTNIIKGFPESYLRYIRNEIYRVAKADFNGAPIRLSLRKSENPYVKSE